jgi:hypothetical protein
MWWWLSRVQSQGTISDPGKRRARRKSGEEAANPELNFQKDLPAYATCGDGDLNFGAPPNSLELSRKERYGAASKVISWFWLIIIILFISPFLLLVLMFILSFFFTPF